MLQDLSIPTSAVEYLRNQIIIGRLSPGQKLDEQRLAAELNISRPPLREAFRLLESERLVMRVPRKGVFVSEISIEDLEDLYQVREMIERCAIDLLRLKNIRDLPVVEKCLENAYSFPTLNVDDLEAIVQYAAVASNFHIKLIESAANPRLTNFYRMIASSVMRYKILFLFLDARYDSRKDHRQLIELIKKGLYEEAKEFLLSHIKISYKILHENILKKPQLRQ